MGEVALPREQLAFVRNNVRDLEILMVRYPLKDIEQRLRLRELQILYRTVAKSFRGGSRCSTEKCCDTPLVAEPIDFHRKESLMSTTRQTR
jgi:hypothetical protein